MSENKPSRRNLLAGAGALTTLLAASRTANAEAAGNFAPGNVTTVSPDELLTFLTEANSFLPSPAYTNVNDPGFKASAMATLNVAASRRDNQNSIVAFSNSPPFSAYAKVLTDLNVNRSHLFDGALFTGANLDNIPVALGASSARYASFADSSIKQSALPYDVTGADFSNASVQSISGAILSEVRRPKDVTITPTSGVTNTVKADRAVFVNMQGADFKWMTQFSSLEDAVVLGNGLSDMENQQLAQKGAITSVSQLLKRMNEAVNEKATISGFPAIEKFQHLRIAAEDLLNLPQLAPAADVQQAIGLMDNAYPEIAQSLGYDRGVIVSEGRRGPGR